MKFKIIFLLILSGLSSYSQIVFEKYYGTIGSNNVGFYLEEISDGYIVTGSSDNDGIVIRTDINGNEVWQQNFSNGSVESFKVNGDGNFLLTGTDYNSPYNAVYRLVDSSGISIWDTAYSSAPFSLYGISGIQMPDSSFVFLENDTYPFQEYLRLRKISSVNQNTIWTKQISKVSNCSSSSLKLTIDSAIVVANGSFDAPYPKLVLSRTLQNGTFDWKKEYIHAGDTGIAGNSVALTNDSGYIVVGYKVFGNPQSDYRLLIMKTDWNGDSLWSKEFNLNNSNAFPDIIQTSDGGFLITGTVVYQPQGSNFDYRIVLMKTDSNGDSLWSREFTGYGLSDSRKIIQTSDGGFAIIGTSTDQSINQNYLYLIKTDSLGSIIPVSLQTIPESQSFYIYPNPSGNNLKIYLNSSYEYILKIDIINSKGQTCKTIEVNNSISQIQIDVGSLPKGIYSCNLIARNGLNITGSFIKID